MSDFTASVRIDLIEPASELNGCIEKYKVWIGIDIPDPFGVGYYLVSVPVAISPSMPTYYGPSGYIASLGPYPFNDIGTLGATIGAAPSFSQSSRSGYTRIGIYGAVEVEYWFHRTMPDLASLDFALEFGTGPSGLPIYHFSQPVGSEIKFTTTYRNGTNAFLQPMYSYAESSTITLQNAACSGESGGGSTTSSLMTRKCLNFGTVVKECLNTAGGITRVELN